MRRAAGRSADPEPSRSRSRAGRAARPSPSTPPTWNSSPSARSSYFSALGSAPAWRTPQGTARATSRWNSAGDMGVRIIHGATSRWSPPGSYHRELSFAWMSSAAENVETVLLRGAGAKKCSSGRARGRPRPPLGRIPFPSALHVLKVVASVLTLPEDEHRVRRLLVRKIAGVRVRGGRRRGPMEQVRQRETQPCCYRLSLPLPRLLRSQLQCPPPRNLQDRAPWRARRWGTSGCSYEPPCTAFVGPQRPAPPRSRLSARHAATSVNIAEASAAAIRRL